MAVLGLNILLALQREILKSVFDLSWVESQSRKELPFKSETSKVIPNLSLPERIGYACSMLNPYGV